MQRDDERRHALLVFETDVAASLAHDGLPGFLQRGDELLAGDDRQSFTHAGSGSLRRHDPHLEASVGRRDVRRPLPPAPRGVCDEGCRG